MPQERKFDVFTKSFPQMFLMGFGSDSMYDLMKASVAKALLVMQEWLIFTEEAHNAGNTMSSIVQKGQTQVEALRYLCLAARKSDEFKNLESQYVQVSNQELQRGQKLLDWCKLAQEGGLTASVLCEIVDALPFFRAKFRPGSTLALESLMAAWVITQMEGISNRELDETLESDLKTFDMTLTALSTEEAAAASLQTVRSAITSKRASIHMESAGKDIMAIATAVAQGCFDYAAVFAWG